MPCVWYLLLLIKLMLILPVLFELIAFYLHNPWVKKFSQVFEEEVFDTGLVERGNWNI